MNFHQGHCDVLALTFRNPIWQAVWLSTGYALATNDDQDNLCVERRRSMARPPGPPAPNSWLAKRIHTLSLGGERVQR